MKLSVYLPSGCKFVDWLVEGIFIEDLAGLLCDSLAQVVVVCLNQGHEALVAGDHASLALSWALYTQALLRTGSERRTSPFLITATHNFH